MTVIKICGICLIASLAAMMMKEARISQTPVVIIGAIIIVTLAVLPDISSVLDITEKINVDEKTSEAIGTMVKSLGVAYLSCTAAEICRESGSSALASKVETVAKLEIIVMSLPYMKSIIEAAIGAVS